MIIISSTKWILSNKELKSLLFILIDAMKQYNVNKFYTKYTIICIFQFNVDTSFFSVLTEIVAMLFPCMV